MRRSRKTLLARLVMLQILCGMIVLAVSVVVHVAQALRDGDGDFDRGMRFHAKVVAAPLDHPDVATRIPLDDLAEVDGLIDEANGFDRRRIAYQVLDRRGTLLHRSVHAPGVALAPLQAGLHELEWAGEHWRVLVSNVAPAGLVVVVGERRRDRWLRSARLAWSVTQPLLMLIPAVLLGSWLASRYAVRPLRRVVAAIAERPAGDLRPMAAAPGVAEIEPLIDELNRLLQRIQEARATERDFFADAAHEIKTPLAVVAAQAHLLSTSTTDAERSTAMRDLEGALQRTSHLVSQLLALAAVDSRACAGEPLLVDLAELVAERLAAMAPRADERGIELSLQAPSKAPIAGFPDELVSLIDNLVDNAIRYNVPGGKVEVALAADAEGTVLKVSDSGPGIPAAERERVFERFYRSPGTIGNGSGLGLSIVRGAVERLGGQVRIESPPDAIAPAGRGTAVLVFIPNAARRRTGARRLSNENGRSPSN